MKEIDGCPHCLKQQAHLAEVTRERDAWKASHECSERTLKSLMDQIPAEKYSLDTLAVQRLEGFIAQAEIGTREIATLQQQLAEAQATIQWLTAQVDSVEKVLRDHDQFRYEPREGLAHLACSVRDICAYLLASKQDNKRLTEERDILRAKKAILEPLYQHTKQRVAALEGALKAMVDAVGDSHPEDVPAEYWRAYQIARQELAPVADAGQEG